MGALRPARRTPPRPRRRGVIRHRGTVARLPGQRGHPSIARLAAALASLGQYRTLQLSFAAPPLKTMGKLPKSVLPKVSPAEVMTRE